MMFPLEQQRQKCQIFVLKNRYGRNIPQKPNTFTVIFQSSLLVFSGRIFNKNDNFKGFWGVGEQHKNAQAERAIQTTIYMACTLMIRVLFNWGERGVDDIFLWSFAIKHAVCIYSWVQNMFTGLIPMELLIQTKTDNKDLLQCHILG